MTQYLIAAEADKIQDLVFRASRLREVFGGSNLLERFCKEIPTEILQLDEQQIVINGGGSFRLNFDSEPAANEGSRTLADLYYMTTGCTMSIAGPESWDGSEADFGRANRIVSQKLRAAKRNHAPGAAAHLPYFAFCASTGVEFASDWHTDQESVDRGYYLSQASMRKRAERKNERLEFLDDFFKKVSGHEPDEKGYFIPPEDADAMGAKSGYDPRNYVAYLLADGNGMGKRFDQISDRQTLRELSEKLTDVVRTSLAAPTKQMIKNYPGKELSDAPALPLLLGGDDLFVLLPAPFAISFAQKFCQAFEQNLGKLLAELKQQPDPAPTIAAAVVICKASYPFHLAHQRGEELLKNAKRRAKSATKSCSTVNFELIIGNEYGQPSANSAYRLTLRPYWSAAGPDDSQQTVDLQTFLDARLQLKDVPQKRRVQLRHFFEAGQLPPKTDANARRQWAQDVDAWIKRSVKLRDGSATTGELWQSLLHKLGSEQSYWREEIEHDKPVFINALPDLLDHWDFLYDLDHKRQDYREDIV